MNLLKLFIPSLFLMLCNPAFSGQADNKKTNKPNILFFLVDDMGWQDCSVPFHTKKTTLNDQYRTPNMEKLSKRSFMFTQAYAAPLCSPSRISLMTGQNAARHGVTCWTLEKNKSPERGRVIKGIHPSRWPYNGLCPDDTESRASVCTQTLPQLLKENGYRTIHVGKAHFGAKGTSGEDPCHFGFDVNIAGHAAGGPGSYYGKNNFSAAWRKASRIWDIPGLEKYHGKDIYLTEALTREALIQLEENKKTDKPFYLYMSHYGVHAPFEADMNLIGNYNDEKMSKHQKVYASMIESMDDSLGKIMQWLKDNSQLNNTIIIFMSDNGSPRENPQNKPLRGHKITGYEGGTRVPMLAYMPRLMTGTSPIHKKVDYPVIIEDIFPTILEAAGVKWKDIVKHEVDGKSLLPLLSGKGTGELKNNRELLWHYPHTYDVAPWSSLRIGDWKLICHYAEKKLELYNIQQDIEENENLFEREGKRAKLMAQRLTSLLKERGANMPLKKDDTSLPYPEEYFQD